MAETHLEVYRPLRGELRDRPLRFWPIVASGLQTALKQRKALLILYAPPVIATVIFSFVVYLAFQAMQMLENDNALEPAGDLREEVARRAALAIANEGLKMLEVVSQILEFNKIMGIFALLAVAWFGSGLFCEDKKAGAHQLYFARPITRLDYCLGKLLTAAFFSLCSMLAPMLVICLVASVSSPEWSFVKEQWDVFPRVIAYSCLWTLVVTTLVLLASSVAPRRSFALIGVIGFVVISTMLGGLFGDLVDPRLYGLGIMIDLNTLSYVVFDRLTPEHDIHMTASAAWTGIALFLAASWVVIGARLRRLEIVA